jgi:hypothetical protein
MTKERRMKENSEMKAVMQAEDEVLDGTSMP